MLYQSLFCFKGLDNGVRFAAISAAVYFLLLVAFLLFGQSAALLVLACLVAPILGLTGYRRMRDVAGPTWYAGLVLIPLFLFAISLVYVTSLVLSSTILVIAGLLSLFFAKLPAVGQAKFYHQGYAGPAITLVSKVHRRRVEPSLGSHVGVGDEDEYDAEESYANAGASEANEHQWQSPSSLTGFSDAIPLSQWINWLKQNQKLWLSVAVALGMLVLVGSLFRALFSDDESSHERVQTIPEQVVAPSRAEAKIPDGFSVLLENDVLIIRWLGEQGAAREIWSLASAQGDRSCAKLIFNDGSNYRPMRVEYMPDTSIEARFSPLDTRDIISDIAMRGSIKLCGYRFSLKGSQSALAKNAAFIAYL